MMTPGNSYCKNCKSSPMSIGCAADGEWQCGRCGSTDLVLLETIVAKAAAYDLILERALVGGNCDGEGRDEP